MRRKRKFQGDPSAAAGWYADPTSRYIFRYWDGAQWTDRVERNSAEMRDRRRAVDMRPPLVGEEPRLSASERSAALANPSRTLANPSRHNHESSEEDHSDPEPVTADGVCSSCGAELTADAKFCPACGTEVVSRHCPLCWRQAEGRARFCKGCGTEIATTPFGLPLEAAQSLSEVFDLLGWCDHFDRARNVNHKAPIVKLFEEVRGVGVSMDPTDPWIWAIDFRRAAAKGRPHSGVFWPSAGGRRRLIALGASRTGFMVSAEGTDGFAYLPYSEIDRHVFDMDGRRVAVWMKTGPVFEFKFKPPVPGWARTMDRLAGPMLLLGSFSGPDVADDQRQIAHDARNMNTLASLHAAGAVRSRHDDDTSTYADAVGGFFKVVSLGTQGPALVNRE